MQTILCHTSTRKFYTTKIYMSILEKIPLVSFWPPQEKNPKDLLLTLGRGFTHPTYRDLSLYCPEANLIL